MLYGLNYWSEVFANQPCSSIKNVCFVLLVYCVQSTASTNVYFFLCTLVCVAGFRVLCTSGCFSPSGMHPMFCSLQNHSCQQSQRTLRLHLFCLFIKSYCFINLFAAFTALKWTCSFDGTGCHCKIAMFHRAWRSWSGEKLLCGTVYPWAAMTTVHAPAGWRMLACVCIEPCYWIMVLEVLIALSLQYQFIYFVVSKRPSVGSYIYCSG